MKGIITYEKDGKPAISSFSYVVTSAEEVYERMHINDIREQKGVWILDNVDFTGTPESIGYAIETMPEFKSRLTKLKVVQGKQWEDKLYSSFKNKR